MLRQFLLPRFTRAFVLRVAVVAVIAFVGFRYVLRPMWIHGGSMEPTYRDGRVNFCFCFRYAFSKPDVGDVVVIRMAGTGVTLLKRVVAEAGDALEFKEGTLYVNGEPREEPYVVLEGKWNTDPVEVKPGYVFVVGDNRSMPAANHKFGQASLDRIAGAPLW